MPFRKMNGLGNDFVVLDLRAHPLALTEELVRRIADRENGVGCDQFITIEPAREGGDAFMGIRNNDGGTVEACGNAARCIGQILLDETGKDHVTIETPGGDTVAKHGPDGAITVDMGEPRLNWDEIPLARATDTLELPIEGAPTATGMGNPHCTFFVEDAEAVDLETRGAEIEHHPLFPERTNVQFASLIAPDHLRMRVWERGVGVTLASGSSSCATGVAAARRGLAGRKVTIDLDGGRIWIDWRADGVWMTGPTMHVFSGHLTPAFLASL